VDRLPFNRPTLAGSELECIKQAVERMHISGNGGFTKDCETLLERTLGVPKVLLTTSCTHALEMAALLLDIQPGDEVILPSFTFVSTANAFVLRGATPVFIDIRPDTLNLDEQRLERLITRNTKAVVPVHYAGVGCDLNTITQIAARHRLKVVEDNAHGLFGRFDGRYLGTFGCLATQSFHETKNVTCGEGGALVINDPEYIQRAEIVREKGTDRSRFLRGAVQKYTWIDYGSSYVLSDILAAFLYPQLRAADTIQAKRKSIWDGYHSGLRDWASACGVRLPIVPDSCEPSYHLFYLILPSETARDALKSHLESLGVNSVTHYVPLHLSQMGKRLSARSSDCPVTEDVAARLLRLPFHNSLSEADLGRVVGAVTSFSAIASHP